METWREEDRAQRRCEVKVYTTNVDPPGSGPGPLNELEEALGPKGWRLISVWFKEPDEDKPPVGAEDYAAALTRLQSAVTDALEELNSFDRIERADDLPSTIRIEDAWEAVEHQQRITYDRIEEAEPDDE